MTARIFCLIGLHKWTKFYNQIHAYYTEIDDMNCIDTYTVKRCDFCNKDKRSSWPVRVEKSQRKFHN